jgi:hypothetical protein
MPVYTDNDLTTCFGEGQVHPDGLDATWIRDDPHTMRPGQRPNYWDGVVGAGTVSDEDL